ncbi:phage tail tip fiber protein, partial [Aeromonas caviae]
ALAEQLTQLQAKVETGDKALDAAIKQNQQAQVTGDSALATRMDKLQATLEGDDQTLNAAILETQRTQAAGDQALADQVTQLQAKVTEGDQTLNAAIQQTQQAQAAGDKANAEAITKVQANLNNTNAAVQSGATATANLRGEVEAGWYTKAKINGEGGGFGLSVKLNADGTTLTSFVVDTDVFAVMSRAAGAASKRHPFIIKNGTVFMNHAMMDTAEIGNVIAKYIKVTNIDAATIVNSDFKGGNAGFGRGGPYSGWGEGWHTIIYADGTIRTNKLYAAAGSFTGEVNANSGTFNNVVMRENCQILGKLSVNQIEGDVTRVYALESYVASDRISFTIPAFSRTRNLVISGIEIYARGDTQGGGGDHSDKPITRTASCAITINGATTSDSVSATGSGNFTSTVCGRTVVIPPNQITSVTIAFTGGYRVRGAVAMVFTQ